MSTKQSLIPTLATLAAFSVAAWAQDAGAYATWADDDDLETNCAQCHGDYDSGSYVSLHDGQEWGTDLMTGHSTSFLSFDCSTCHTGSLIDPVLLDSSDGGNGLAPISCLGCHGRAEPAAGGQVTGAGLRQHHWNAGVSDCQSACHQDADPTLFTTVSEDTLPPYFADPGIGHPNIPSDPCNPSPDFTEDVLGDGAGLDNDGNGLYDVNGSEPLGLPPAEGDPACMDTDIDGVYNGSDNCTLAGNLDQRDTDSDGFGNACDPDLNDDGVADFLDLGLMKSVFFTDDADADLNGDGSVDFLDLGLMKSRFFLPPGPSGLACAGTIPCP